MSTCTIAVYKAIPTEHCGQYNPVICSACALTSMLGQCSYAKISMFGKCSVQLISFLWNIVHCSSVQCRRRRVEGSSLGGSRAVGTWEEKGGEGYYLSSF